MALFPRKRVSVIAQRPKDAERLLTEASGYQSGANAADWFTGADHPFSLVQENGNFHLSRIRFKQDLPFLSLSHWQKPEVLPIDIQPKPQKGRPQCMMICFSAAEPLAANGAFLEQIITGLNAPDAPRPTSALIVIDEALALLSAGSAPIDAVEEWERARAGEPSAVPPTDLAKWIDAWRAPLVQLNMRLENRLNTLESTLARSAKQFAVLPISQTGFHATTGEILASGTTNVPAIPFNLAPLVQALAGVIPDSYPRFSRWGDMA